MNEKDVVISNFKVLLNKETISILSILLINNSEVSYQYLLKNTKIKPLKLNHNLSNLHTFGVITGTSTGFLFPSKEKGPFFKINNKNKLAKCLMELITIVYKMSFKKGAK